jgi:membrane-associated phospholipid phosphatase
MQSVIKCLQSDNNFSKSIKWAIGTGCFTILLVIFVKQSENQYIRAFGKFLGGRGNDIFLIGTNVLLFVWAGWRRLQSVINFTLGIDLLVLIFVQGIKQLNMGSWCFRPSGSHGGFPSGHTTHAFAMAFLLTSFFPRLAWLWYSLAAAISWSRVETNSHTGLQVAVGTVLGIVIALVMVRRWLKRQETMVPKYIAGNLDLHDDWTVERRFPKTDLH